jgi:hypothetical protein
MFLLSTVSGIDLLCRYIFVASQIRFNHMVCALEGGAPAGRVPFLQTLADRVPFLHTQHTGFPFYNSADRVPFLQTLVDRGSLFAYSSRQGFLFPDYSGQGSIYRL